MLYTTAGLLMATTVAIGTAMCWRAWLSRGSVVVAADGTP